MILCYCNDNVPLVIYIYIYIYFSRTEPMANHGEGAGPRNSCHSFTSLDQRPHSKLIASFHFSRPAPTFTRVAFHSLIWANEETYNYSRSIHFSGPTKTFARIASCHFSRPTGTFTNNYYPFTSRDNLRHLLV
jgi:hypothetical protein